jgi:hypothetical protein
LTPFEEDLCRVVPGFVDLPATPTDALLEEAAACLCTGVFAGVVIVDAAVWASESGTAKNTVQHAIPIFADASFAEPKFTSTIKRLPYRTPMISRKGTPCQCR